MKVIGEELPVLSVNSCRFEAPEAEGHQQARSYRNWNPPLLGNLPEDFLRILPQQLDSMKVTAGKGSLGSFVGGKPGDPEGFFIWSSPFLTEMEHFCVSDCFSLMSVRK